MQLHRRPPQGTFQQLIGSLVTLGAFLSSLFTGSFAHFLGRKPALWLAFCGRCQLPRRDGAA